MGIKISKELAASLGIVMPRKSASPRGMNKLESKYAAKLEMDKQFGDVAWYAYEPVRLLLAKGAWYKPDFMVLSKSGETYFVECKGFWREAARVRIKVAADKYPYRFVAVQWIGGEWVNEWFCKD